MTENNKNSKNRWKNIWTYIGIIGIIGTALGVDGSTLTSWPLLWQSILSVIQNPFAIGTVIMALAGNYCDATTGGLKD